MCWCTKLGSGQLLADTLSSYIPIRTTAGVWLVLCQRLLLLCLDREV